MNKRTKSYKGLSFLVTVGSFGGFHITCSSSAINICIGWIAFTIFFYDVQNAFENILLDKNELPNAVKVLIDNLEKDEDYRRGWKDNISMAFQDTSDHYDGSVLTKQIADEAAERFLNNLCN